MKSYPLNIFTKTLQGYWTTLSIIGAYFALIVGVWVGIKFLHFRAARPVRSAEAST